ncbi:MAG: cyclic nucleotide-binding domain-containing protein [Chloroflexota bacterium]
MNELINFLKQADVFYQFTSTQLELVANLCQEKTFPAGEIIFEESSNSKELYIIAHGEIDILIDPGIVESYDKDEKFLITTLRRGQSFGEIALVDEGLRSATARVKGKETRLLVIPREKLIMLCETYPQLGYRLMYNLAADLALKTRNADLRVRNKNINTEQKASPIISIRENTNQKPISLNNQQESKQTIRKAISNMVKDIFEKPDQN